MEDRLMDDNTEDYLEILYWEFDADKKKFSFTERDLFKAKMRGLIRTIQNTRATDPPEDITGLAHELWALAQLMPEEGILDGVMRIEEALQGKIKGTKDPLMDKMAELLMSVLAHGTNAIYPNGKSIGDDINKALQEYRERKMPRIVEIEYCGDCPHRFYKGNDLFCELTDKQTGENTIIPDWCPLPENKEIK